MDTNTHRCLCYCNGPVKEEEPKMSESVGSCFSFDLNQLPPAEHRQQEAPPEVALGEAQNSKIRGEGDQSGFNYFNFIYKKLKGLFNILFKKVEIVPKPMFDFDLNELPPAEDQEATSPNVMEVSIGEAEGSYWLINLINKMLKVHTYSAAAEEKPKEEG